jgi:hypothetical protein
MSDEVNEQADRHVEEVPSTWTKEAETPRFTDLRKNFDSFRHNLYEAKGQAPNEPLPEMAYTALSEMSDAMKNLFEDPLSVANVPSEPNERYGTREPYINHNRNGFLSNLTRVMETLNITPQDLQNTIDRNRQIEDSVYKKGTDSPDVPHVNLDDDDDSPPWGRI